jgi:transposase
MNTLSEDALVVASRQQLIDAILSLQERLQKQSSHVEQLEFQLEWFKRQMFGAKSERFIDDDEQQLMLDLGIEPTSPPPRQTENITYDRRKPAKSEKKTGHGRGPMPTHLPIEDKIIEPDEDVSGMVRIGEEVSWYYEMEPASLRVVRITRPKYARAGGEGMLTGELPSLPIDKGNAGPGLITHIVIDKFVYHMPLDRQRKKFHSEYAVEFAESWLCDQVRAAAGLIKPVYDAYVNNLLRCRYVCADETPIPVLIKNKRGKTHRGYFWVYYDPLSKITIFDYRDSRARAGPSEFLRDFSGTLQVDGYEGYNEIILRNGIQRAACMDHVRRRFEKALAYDQQRARHALDIMHKWYEVEDEARTEGLTLAQRFERRQAQTVPSMRAFKDWLNEQLGEVLPKSPIGAAICYALNQWPFFEPFMSDERIELSNIQVENKIRPVAIGRKNYLFKGSHEAAKRAARIYSLVATARNHNVDPFVYIRELLTHLPDAMMTEIAQFLLPNWQAPSKPATV